jgi:hypothetical protein
VALQAVPGEDAVCVSCGVATAVVRCRDCLGFGPAGSVLLCAACDAWEHAFAHFHQRHVWIEGFYRPVGMEFDVAPSDCEGRGGRASTPLATPTRLGNPLHVGCKPPCTRAVTAH